MHSKSILWTEHTPSHISRQIFNLLKSISKLRHYTVTFKADDSWRCKCKSSKETDRRQELSIAILMQPKIQQRIGGKGGGGKIGHKKFLSPLSSIWIRYRKLRSKVIHWIYFVLKSDLVCKCPCRSGVHWKTQIWLPNEKYCSVRLKLIDLHLYHIT